MTVSIGRMSIDYYLDNAMAADGKTASRRDLTAYYTATKAPTGQWWGTGLSALSLNAGSAVTSAAARAIYEDVRDPNTGMQLGRPLMKKTDAPADAKTPSGQKAKDIRSGVAGFDLTFSAPKSVSTLWAVADAPTQKAIHDAHEQAVKETLAWVEANVIQSRAGQGGVARMPVKGIVASMFDHWDSRAGDPQLHTHVVVSNRVQRVLDNQWRTLDSQALYKNVVAISEMYNSLLYDRVYEKVGAVAGMREGIEQLVNADTLSAEKEYRAPQRVELDGVPDELITEFSARTRDIEDAVAAKTAEYRESHRGAAPPANVLWQFRAEATLATRQAKKPDYESLAQKCAQWRQRAANAGFTPEQVVEATVGKSTAIITEDLLEPSSREKLAVWALDDAVSRRSSVTGANVRASLERLLRCVRMDSAQEREHLVNELLDTALDHAVALNPGRYVLPDTGLTTEDAVTAFGGASIYEKPEDAKFTTGWLLKHEQYLQSRITAAAHEATMISMEEIGQEQLISKDGHPLSDDQRDAVLSVCADQKAMSAIIGPAGTGKTTTMRALAHIWAEQHGDNSVIGLAPSTAASKVLGEDIGHETENTAKWLYETVGEGARRRIERMTKLEQDLNTWEGKPKSKQSRRIIENLRTELTKLYTDAQYFQMRPGQLVIVDEASLASTVTLSQLAKQADEAGAKMVLVGDPKQLAAVDAGGFLGWVEDHEHAVHLSMLWRFSNEWERDATLKLREGAENVISTYAEHGRLIQTSPDTTLDTVYAAWKHDTDEQGLESLMIANTNEDVVQLNLQAQRDRISAGTVDMGRHAAIQDGHAGVGDRILARQNDRSITTAQGHYIHNGTLLTVTDVHEDGSVSAVRDDDGDTVTLDPSYLQKHVQLGYACTIHRAQGTTVDTCHSIVNEHSYRELVYVSMTRGKHANHAYVEVAEHGEDAADPWEMMAEVRADTMEGVMTGALGVSGASQSATRTRELSEKHGLGELIHDWEHLAELAATLDNMERLTSEYGHETVLRLQEHEAWGTLMKNDLTVMTLPETPDMETLIERSTPRDEQVTGAVLTRINNSAREDIMVTRDALDAAIADSVERKRAAVEIEETPPAWLAEFERIVPADRRDAALDAVLMWRAASNQDTNESATSETDVRVLGDAPHESDSKHRLYVRAYNALYDLGANHDPWEVPNTNEIRDAWIMRIHEDPNVSKPWKSGTATTGTHPPAPTPPAPGKDRDTSLTR